MPVFPYRCDQCGDEHEESYPIGTARRMMRCACGGIKRQVLGRGMWIGADALPNKRHAVRAADARERRWDADMPAYRRMRLSGLQPRTIDGAARLEDRAGDQQDINFDRLIGTAKNEQQRRSLKARVSETQAAVETHPGIVA